MNARWWLVVCALALSACGGGGGGGDASGQSPFQVLVAESRSQPLETACSQRSDYSVLETLEVRVSAAGLTVEAFDRGSYHGSTNCTGAALVQSRVLANTAEVPVARITYVSSLRSAQVRLLNGRTLNTAVDRVNFATNPEAGVYRFDFLSVTGTQQTIGFNTSASFTINGIAVNLSLGLEPSSSDALGIAVVDGQTILVRPESDTVFVEQ